MENLEVTDVQIFSGCGTANIAFNDEFMIQLDSTDGEWSIPCSTEMPWRNDDDQDAACEKYNADELAAHFDLEPNIEFLRENFGCDEY